jgi:nucleotide-binding universal stress UspA family protein
MNAAPTDDRTHTDHAPLRVLLTVHGYEPPGWATATAGVVSRWPWCTVRLLATLDVPCPPFTSLHRLARGAYAAARARCIRLEEARLQPTISALLSALPRAAGVVSVPAIQGDVARTVAEHARDWAPDVVVVGAPGPGRRSWLWPGPVHQRLVRLTGATVLVTAAPAPATPAARRRPVAKPAAAMERTA